MRALTQISGCRSPVTHPPGRVAAQGPSALCSPSSSVQWQRRIPLAWGAQEGPFFGVYLIAFSWLDGLP